MVDPSKIEMVKKLECLVAFQRDCLNGGNWEDFDRIEGEIKKLEEEIAGGCNFSP